MYSTSAKCVTKSLLKVRLAVTTIFASVWMVPAHAATPASAPVAWTAKWISDPRASSAGPGVYFFRKVFTVENKPDRFPIRISADNRYRLLINGVEVSSGPARGDLLHWRYETIDIAAQMVAGKNVLAVLVWNMGEYRPAAQISLQTGLLVQGDGPSFNIVNTGKGWKVQSSLAYSFSRVEGVDTGGYYVAGPREEVDGALYPWGWEKVDFDDSGWTEARPVKQGATALARGTQLNGEAWQWQLVPRNIPQPDLQPTRFASVRRALGVSVPRGFIEGHSALEIPAHTKATLLLDQGAMTTGYPLITVTGGAKAKATLTYSEGLFDAAGQKGNRNEIDGKEIRGLRDTFHFEGGEKREYRSLWLRAWRYTQLDVETADQPLRIDNIQSIFSAYPFKQKAAFESDASWVKPIWDMDWRALRLSAFETFWDTPYYEQLQYVGDTRIEALLSIYQSGDDRLMRNAIESFDNSRTSEGLTASAYPSSIRQQIPPFSLWWVAMVHDYWMLRDDNPFIRERLRGVRDVLDWYESHLDDSGLLGPMPWWNFLDWAKDYNQGIPPGGAKGHSVALTLQFILALQQAAELERGVGRQIESERDAALAGRLIATLREKAWNEKRGLFVDSLEDATYSQQTNSLAVLAGAVPAGHERDVMETVLGDLSLEQATFYFRFYVDEAMRQAGLADRYLGRLEPWKTMIKNGMTTTAETPEPTRSDSHAWAAHPNYELLATVLGIRSAAPGFREISISPSLGSLTHARGKIPHPNGDIEVEYNLVRDSLVAAIILPPGTTGTFQWHSQVMRLKPGKNNIRCPLDRMARQ